MAHKQMFDANNPWLVRLREVCLDFPEAKEKVTHGRPCFYTKKIFAIYGATTKGAKDPAAHQNALVFLPDPEESVALDNDERFFTPAYWGPYGWRAVDLDQPEVSWEEVKELLEDSFLQTASPKLARSHNQNSAR